MPIAQAQEDGSNARFVKDKAWFPAIVGSFSQIGVLLAFEIRMVNVGLLFVQFQPLAVLSGFRKVGLPASTVGASIVSCVDGSPSAAKYHQELALHPPRTVLC